MRTAIKTGMLGLLAFGVALSYTASCGQGGGSGTAEPAKILVAKTFKPSKLIGLNVRNKEGEKLGTVNDLVLNIETGKIAYVALSVGGVWASATSCSRCPMTSWPSITARTSSSSCSTWPRKARGGSWLQ